MVDGSYRLLLDKIGKGSTHRGNKWRTETIEVDFQSVRTGLFG